MPAATGDTTTAATAKSGIQTSTTGESIIPSSTRADGSVRKEIRVRPGYRPPEDIEVYKNRAAEAWKNRGSGGVPGAEGLNSEEDKATGQLGPATNKNAKRREARKKASAAAKAEAGEGGANGVGSSKNIESNSPQGSQINGAADLVPDQPVDSAAEKEKEARKLSKKLRQAKDLKDKKDKGDSLLPEQFEKVIKMNELIRQLDALGFDAEGERKNT
ncbi:MAG: hypothetical protein Q9165_003908 [Trypethelium subeluteriae]